MSSNALRVSVMAREEEPIERTDLTKWAQTVLLIESKKPQRSAMANLRTLAAHRILPLTLAERELLEPKGKNQS